MSATNLKKLAQETARKNKFKLKKLIYQGNYYSPKNIRNLIYEVEYQNREAILKIYDDPRTTDEPIALKKFNQFNKSKILKAPKVYKSQIISAQQGWLIMEKLPDGGNFFKTPVTPAGRQEVLKVYLEYRKHFPKKSWRQLTLTEQLPANLFHRQRIAYWFNLLEQKEQERLIKDQKQYLTTSNNFLTIYNKSLKIIDQVFASEPMIWCHGHFKPEEIYKCSENEYYLTDFAHCKMYPQSYELAFMIWADFIMTFKAEIKYTEFKEHINAWIQDLRQINQELKIKNFDRVIKAAIIERLLGTIIADLGIRDLNLKIRNSKFNILTKYLKETINS